MNERSCNVFEAGTVKLLKPALRYILNDMEQFDLLVIGGGAAGMAASLSASEKGRRVLLIEKETELGGILNQCIHHGFGLGVFREDLTGQEYAARFVPEVYKTGISVETDTAVLSLDPDRTAVLSGPKGVRRVGFTRCILAAGCMERSIGSLDIAGTRPAGVLTAGTAQQLMNLGDYNIGSRIVILGSGNVGQIMARQFVQSGRKVIAMIEQMDHAGGMERNRRECLEAFRIPLILNTTVEEILGQGRIRGVKTRNLITGEQKELACDTLVTAMGLIPDRTLCRGLEENGKLPSWLRPCGNCEKVHDIVDSVTFEARELGAIDF